MLKHIMQCAQFTGTCTLLPIIIYGNWRQIFNSFAAFFVDSCAIEGGFYQPLMKLLHTISTDWISKKVI